MLSGRAQVFKIFRGINTRPDLKVLIFSAWVNQRLRGLVRKILDLGCIFVEKSRESWMMSVDKIIKRRSRMSNKTRKKNAMTEVRNVDCTQRTSRTHRKRIISNFQRAYVCKMICRWNWKWNDSVRQSWVSRLYDKIKSMRMAMSGKWDMLS